MTNKEQINKIKDNAELALAASWVTYTKICELN